MSWVVLVWTVETTYYKTNMNKHLFYLQQRVSGQSIFVFGSLTDGFIKGKKVC